MARMFDNTTTASAIGAPDARSTTVPPKATRGALASRCAWEGAAIMQAMAQAIRIVRGAEYVMEEAAAGQVRAELGPRCRVHALLHPA
ncbi:MAG: hypothetical protein H0V06_06010 [Gemmatimonadetes bacterium]|nr:hypothetical protein [Gemmatimonadota bacterium]